VPIEQTAVSAAPYVRSIVHELGQKIGCGAHLATLRRLVSGKFDVEDAIQVENLLKLSLSELQKDVIPFLSLAGQPCS